MITDYLNTRNLDFIVKSIFFLTNNEIYEENNLCRLSIPELWFSL